MNEIALNLRSLPAGQSRRAMAVAVKTWFVTAALGHWIFLAYITAALFPPLMHRGLEGLNDLQLTGGLREGDLIGNLAAAAHVLLAAIIIGGGPLQLIPAIRQRYPLFHRVLGRSYFGAALISSMAGLYMVWTRGTVGGLVNYLGISLDAILIVVFAALAFRYAVMRDIRNHRRWVLRLFMAASAVWFFRVGLMGWVMLTGGAGIDFDTFTGPVPSVLTFAQYLLPLAMLEWYFHCQDQPAASRQHLVFTGVLAGLTLYMGFGIFAATLGLWLPRM